MAFILGPEIERAISQSLSLSKGDIFGYIIFERPITVVILVLTPIIAWYLWAAVRQNCVGNLYR